MYTLSIQAETYEELQNKIAKLNRNNIYGKMEIFENNEKVDKKVKDLLKDAIPVESESANPVASSPENPLAKTLLDPMLNAVVDKINGDLDSAGMPHDPRIHSDTKTKLKTGVWRLKKGLDAEVFEKVTKELMTPVVPVVIPPPPPVTIPVEIPPQVATPPPVQPVVSPAALLPVENKYADIPIPQTGKPAHTLATFQNNLMAIIADLINQGKIDQNYIEELKKYFEVKEIWNINGSAKKVTELYETFAKCGFITALE